MAPYMACVFEALFGEARQKVLGGNAQPLDGAEKFAVDMIRQRGTLKVLLPEGRDVMDDVAFTFPFDRDNSALPDWTELPSYKGQIGCLSVMGEILGVNEGHALMLVHEYACGSKPLSLEEPICLIVPAVRAQYLVVFEAE
jgi:hypothetical protein